MPTVGRLYDILSWKSSIRKYLEKKSLNVKEKENFEFDLLCSLYLMVNTEMFTGYEIMKEIGGKASYQNIVLKAPFFKGVICSFSFLRDVA